MKDNLLKNEKVNKQKHKTNGKHFQFTESWEALQKDDLLKNKESEQTKN